jgi:hypothetical protein
MDALDRTGDIERKKRTEGVRSAFERSADAARETGYFAFVPRAAVGPANEYIRPGVGRFNRSLSIEV